MKSKGNQRRQQVDKSGTDLRVLFQQYEVHNKTEGKSPKTVLWYNELLGAFYGWLNAQLRCTSQIWIATPT